MEAKSYIVCTIGVTYTDVISSNDHIFVVGSEKSIRQLKLKDLTTVKNIESNSILTNIVLAGSKSALFTSTGMDYSQSMNMIYKSSYH